MVSDALVDGKSVGAVTSYTFETVREDHSIQAIFELSEKAQDAIRNEKLKEGVKNTTIRLRSTLGNGYVDWTGRNHRATRWTTMKSANPPNATEGTAQSLTSRRSRAA